MFNHDYILTQPVFFLFIAFTVLLSLGYLWGKRVNKRVFLAAFNDLVDVVKPDDQTFTNIGGLVGYHANLYIKKNDALISQLDATITLLPRHSWLYLPISKFIMRYDRLFITLYVKPGLPGEAHIIETRYASFRAPKITNKDRLDKETVQWGSLHFDMYYQNLNVRSHLIQFMEKNPDPGIIRHIALVPEQRKSFVFMIPRTKQVAPHFAPIYEWLPSVVKK